MKSEANAPRQPLTKERILEAAVDVADRDGLGALTMRRLGKDLGFEAMAIYKHVANKEEILEGMLALVIGQIEIPEEGADWKEAMRRRAFSVREVLSRHSWAIELLAASGFAGPAALRYINAILGNLRSGGFTIEDAAHAFWLLDSYVYGHVIQETSMPIGASDETTDPESILEQDTIDQFSYLVEIRENAQMRSEFSFDSEFEYGLDLILEVLELLQRRRADE